MAFSVVALTSAASVALPAIAGLTIYRKLGRNERFFLGYIVFSVLFEASSLAVGLITKNNLWMFKLFLIVEFLFFIWYYRRALDKPLWNERVNRVLIAIMLPILLLPYFFPGMNQYLSWFHFIFFLFFLIQSVLAILKIFEQTESNLFGRPVFWVSFARMFYFMTNLFAFVYPELPALSSDKEIIAETGAVINSISNISLNIGYSISFLCLTMKK